MRFRLFYRILSLQIVEQVRNCTGYPISIVDKDNGSEVKWTCSLCSGTTSYWCIGCRAFYCMKGGPTERKCQNKSGRDPEYYEIDMIEENKVNKTKTTKQVYGIKSCYHKVHEEAYQRKVSGFTNQSDGVDNDAIQQLMQLVVEKHTGLNR